jgi:hypothetical protein
LIVFINNDGANPINADGTVYFIRDVT